MQAYTYSLNWITRAGEAIKFHKKITEDLSLLLTHYDTINKLLNYLHIQVIFTSYLALETAGRA